MKIQMNGISSCTAFIFSQPLHLTLSSFTSKPEIKKNKAKNKCR